MKKYVKYKERESASSDLLALNAGMLTPWSPMAEAKNVRQKILPPCVLGIRQRTQSQVVWLLPD